MSTADLDREIILCPTWCVEKGTPDGHSDEYVDGSGVHFAHVGTADQVNVMLTRALHDDTRVAPVRVELWADDAGGQEREIHLPPSTTRSLAHWLTVAADRADGPQYTP
ncbi:MAG TPA: hypothetical protein VHI11_10140 [Jiangellaceae bacterium]|jgi:hypothetical protein|nr:hypothetical protein [Jiangellaceae bacterium]